jgi:hypothetical protein
MAQEVTLNGSTVKIRHPFGPIGLSIITLGIYGLYWYYAVNKELQADGEKVEPVMSLLAITLGALIIVPPFVSLYNTAARTQRAQQRHGAASEISPVLALIMVFIPIVSFFLTVYMQSSLNSAWERVSASA